MTLFFRTTLFLFIILSFYGCAPNDRVISDKDTDRSRFDTKESTDSDRTTESPDHYIQLASVSTGITRNKHLLKAAEILIQLKKYDLAEKQISDMNHELISEKELIEIKMLQAELELSRDNPRDALKLLNIASILPTEQQVKLLQLRARAFLQANYPLESAKTRVQMGQLLTDEFDQELNHQAIWEALSLLPKTSLHQISQAPLNADFLAWVELAKIAKHSQVDWQHLQEGIYQWRKKHPEHPAAKIFISGLNNKQIELIDHPKHIAVLLPLNGRYAQVAGAIRDGIMSSYYQQTDKASAPKLSFIDTSDNQAAIWNYYKKAVDQGADFIIGPFLKTAVDTLTNGTQVSVPTLTLNYASTENKNSDKLFQFGLLPEDEASQSAEIAFRESRTHAAVLVPEGAWGERLRDAFQSRFVELGGTVVSTQTYTPNKNDFKQPIQNMLNIKQSYTRYRSIQNTMNTKMQFTPYRRQDVDMIFMAATPKDARQLKPQFKFHYAGEIPVYATSHAFTGQLNKQADRDIDDLNFLDMPWILNPPTKAKQSLITYWPEQQRYTRFFALGVDAYNLIPFLGRLQGTSYERFSGQTGNLYLDSFNRIHRELLPAKFVRGIPKLIDINTLPINLTLDESKPIQQPIQ